MILSSCINFAVLSPTTGASSISPDETSLGFGNYARNFYITLRKGIYKDEFFGFEVGGFLGYALPSQDFRSTTLLFDTKVSLFEFSKNKFASGVGVSYLSLLEVISNQYNYINSFYLVFPMYMESSLTEWFKFILNFRLFHNIYFPKGDYPVSISNYGKNLLTINAGMLFFSAFAVEGYIIGGENLSSFPVPGFRLEYSINF